MSDRIYIIAQGLLGIGQEAPLDGAQGVHIVAPLLEHYDRMDSSVVAPRFRDQLAVQDVLHDTLQAEERVVETGVSPMSIIDVRIQLGQSIVGPGEQVGHVLLGDTRPPIYEFPQLAAEVVRCVHLALHPRLCILGDCDAARDSGVGRVFGPAVVVASVLEDWSVFENFVPDAGADQAVTDGEGIKE